jgi:hypothetical protein
VWWRTGRLRHGSPRRHKHVADAVSIEKGIEIALDVEQLVYEVNTFLNAASLINRISKG